MTPRGTADNGHGAIVEGEPDPVSSETMEEDSIDKDSVSVDKEEGEEEAAETLEVSETQKSLVTSIISEDVHPYSLVTLTA